MKDITDNQNAWFLYGYIYAQAEKLKKDGLFKDLTIKEIIEILIRTQTNK